MSTAALSYLLSSPFNPAMELEINPFDETLDVPWRLDEPAIMSEKDAAAPSLNDRIASGQLPTYRDVGRALPEALLLASAT